MDKAFIGYTDSKGVIKTVSVNDQGSLDCLGVEINENFKDLSDVKDLVKSSIDYVEDGEAVYMDNLTELSTYDYEFIEYNDKADFIDDMEADTYYYLFENDRWYVSKPNLSDFQELEAILEAEY